MMGSDMMGSEVGDDDEKPVHKVTISKPFYLGKYAVTQEQWVAVMGEGSNESDFKGRTNPVETVSWNDAQEFIKKLNEKEGTTGYRLPTEAEWEHAARAGTETEWFFGNNEKAMEEYAWCDENSQKSAHPVGQKQPNPWDLYDMYGNVWEWVEDWYGEFKAGAVTDPAGPEKGSFRVKRGGSWYVPAKLCRSAYRGDCSPGDPDYRDCSVGFRLAFSPVRVRYDDALFKGTLLSKETAEAICNVLERLEEKGVKL